MAFSSISFIFGFLPLTLLCYYFCPARLRQGRNFILLVLSLAFYAWGGVKLVPVLAVYCLTAWGGGLLCAPERKGRKSFFWASVAVQLGLLAYFKTTALPAGISFFAFQAIAYLADVYLGRIPAERRLDRVTLFLAFFPQILQGPILRYEPFAPALTERKESLADAADGLERFCFGLAKKVLLADMLGKVADGAFGAGGRLTVSLAWLGAIAYTLQLYFDFSGYTDMAMGLGRVFGFCLPENFDYPYVARSASEFWRRWHITLSQWFRDYVYIPLGGNRCSRTMQIRNLLVVWLLTGIWHGSTWNFLLWGLYYAVLLIGEKYVWGRRLEMMPAWLRHGYGLVLITVGWVLFRCGSLAQIGQMLGAMTGITAQGLWSGETLYYILEFKWELMLGVICAAPVIPAIREKWGEKTTMLLRLVALVLFGLSVIRLMSSATRSFLYFQF